MALRTIIAGIIVALLPASALAVPPPPPPLKFTQSWDAIEELSPFMGEWHGTEVQHVKGAGDFAIPAYWRLSRLGGQDVIMLEHGYESKTPPQVERATSPVPTSSTS